jgi:methylamine dehydrogenase accessory protein MauD
MLTVLTISQVISWLIIGGLTVALLAVARQVGVLHMRVAPAGALMPLAGPKVGEAAPTFDSLTIDRKPVAIGKPMAKGKRQLLMFVSPMCPICKELIPVAKSFVRDERLDVVFVGDDALADQKAMIAQFGLAGLPFVNGPDLGRAFAVDKLPHAVLIDDAGVIVSKGLVNSREHLESLVVSHEMGVTSVQDYLVSRKAKVA